MQYSLPITNVDAPNAEYLKAAVVVEDDIVVVRNLVGVVLKTYTLDAPPQVMNDTDIPSLRIFRATVDGSPLIVREIADCHCGGTRVIPKQVQV